MHDLTMLPHETIEEKVIYYDKYFEKQGKDYPQEQLKEAIEYLSYKHAPKELPKEESDEYSTLYVFRHGQTTDNADFIFSGWRDVDITEIGVKQALDLAEDLKDKHFDRLIASDQIRAIKTMELAMSKNESAKNLKIEIDPRIKEKSYGDYQGTSKLEFYMQNKKLLLEIRRSFKHQPPNGESIEMVCGRVAKFCDELVSEMKKKKMNVAISCHGNSIRGFRRYFEHLSDYDTAHVETPLGQDYYAYVIK